MRLFSPGIPELELWIPAAGLGDQGLPCTTRQHRDRCPSRHGIIRTTIKHPAGLLLLHAAPLLKEEVYVRNQALPLDLDHPVFIHWPCAVAALTADDHPDNPVRSTSPRSSNNGSMERNRFAAGALRKESSRGSPYFLSSTLTPTRYARRSPRKREDRPAYLASGQPVLSALDTYAS